ncbi:MarR family winged helix-turn-helix transcriptional regulator [Telmatobacter bradus]|uniref:MarR family winged helix-turn-helix transcriptional regulator n=1 Tax=Telmatobacter bradus TaxID=474953 RepID=UPI003B431D61
MKRTAGGDQFTQIVLSTFRLHGTVVAAGDRMVEDLGLSTARWQVLGMIVDQLLTVSAIARRMGLTRQSVQRIADRLVAEGFASAIANPDHQSAKLYILSAMGKQVMAQVEKRQAAWANRISDGLALSDLSIAGDLLQTLINRLESDNVGG